MLYNKARQDYSLLDTTLTNTFQNNYTTHQAGIGLRQMLGKNALLVFGAIFQNASLTGNETFPITATAEHTFNDVLPNLLLRYKISEHSNLRFFYRTSTNVPSVTQLQNVIDNSNPLVVTTGAPDLKQAYTHSAIVRYALNNPEGGGMHPPMMGNGGTMPPPANGTPISMFVLLNATYTQNNISNQTILAQRDTVLAGGVKLNKGAQLIVPVNLDGAYSARAFFTYGFPIKAIKVNANLNTGVTFNRTPALINRDLNLADSYGLSQGVVLGSNISEGVDFTLASTATYSIAQNSIQPSLNNNYYTQTTTVRGVFQAMHGFAKGFLLQTDLSQTFYTGLSNGYNQSIWLWNASIGKKFLKNDAGELKITAFDLLHQNNAITRNIADTYIEDVRTRVLQQYVMLSFTYTLRAFKQ